MSSRASLSGENAGALVWSLASAADCSMELRRMEHSSLLSSLLRREHRSSICWCGVCSVIVIRFSAVLIKFAILICFVEVIDGVR